VNVPRQLLTLLLTALVMVGVSAGPAAAHAELVSTNPADGARLESPPGSVTLRFTEDVNLIDGGLRLIDGRGRTVPTAAPTVQGHSVAWSMPTGLAHGTYLVNWRVVSVDGHPVSGAFAFGIGADARPVDVTSAGTGTAPWPVVTVRWAGYLAFALLVGVVVFVGWCSPAGRRDPTAQLLGRIGLVGGVLTTVAELLVQGPYAGGTSWGRLFDPDLLGQTAGTPFGEALLWRLVLFGVLFFGVWVLEWLETDVARWLVAGGVVAAAGTFAAAGHGAASGSGLDIGVDAVHVLAASTWVGGLMVVAVVGRSVERRALHQFSRVAMASVLVLVATGVVNAVLRLHSVVQLFDTRYGLLLVTKVLVVGAALAAAAVSRQRLRAGASLAATVRAEAAVTVVVLGLTAALALTSPPPSVADPATAAAGAGSAARSPASAVTFTLPGGGSALVNVNPPGTAGSRIRLGVLDAHGQLVRVRAVKLQASVPARGVDNIDVPLARAGQVWTGRFTFPLTGTWKLTLTVQGRSSTAVVTTATLPIGR
jgi:copper transport protein